MMFVKIRDDRKVAVNQQRYNTHGILRCYVHETMTPSRPKDQQRVTDQYYLVDCKKECTPYDGVINGDRIERYFIDPDFKGFQDEAGVPIRMYMDWLCGSDIEVITINSNEEAVHFLHSDSDYVNID